ncbi:MULTISPECIES: glycosyltransferase [unclassified Nocardioides]|uniref:glycosyltransferase n=1 Tax=unclassified Nocardioides TaxID=2615069 RepID=UPI0006F4F68B|nr:MULTISPECIES: glycosyltransferase family 2 protein [unclassified Nocardioides]KRA32436.1 hydrolase [Nocardioides sp. Root614]KRA89089.1 hydrolase [Nocardioides sp. Root682]
MTTSGRLGLQRTVGVLIFGTASAGAGLLWWSVSDTDDKAPESTDGIVLGAWHLLYDNEIPALTTLAAAAGLALLFAAGVALLERRITNRARRSDDAGRLPLSPRHVMAQTRGQFHGEATLTVLVPAHNEGQCIADTLASLFEQSYPPKRVIVVADNCTDDTIAVAVRAGAEVIESRDNVHKKAGALNQALAQVLPGQGENDLVMVMDADTSLDAGFLEAVVRRMSGDRALMAIGGMFYGEDGKGLIGQFQRNEYTRYARDLRRRRGRVFVLTGTATAFRPRALRTIAEERGKMLPGVPGDVYDTLVLTEDNEITLALKTLGGLIVSPAECTVVTEVMPTWRGLWVQRLRWQRGALENLGTYGMRPATFRYWAQQLGIGYGVIALLAYLLMMTLMTLSFDAWVWFPFWLGTGLVFTAERILTVWRGGWRARLLAATLFPELFYALFLDIVYLKGIVDMSVGRTATWQEVVQTPTRRKVAA